VRQSGDVISFKMPEEKEDFLRWREQKGEGFVLNQKSRTDFKLHKASCNDLEPWIPEGLQNDKHCAIHESALREFWEDGSVELSTCGNRLPGHL
jgi:hypothetical protein